MSTQPFREVDTNGISFSVYFDKNPLNRLLDNLCKVIFADNIQCAKKNNIIFISPRSLSFDAIFSVIFLFCLLHIAKAFFCVVSVLCYLFYINKRVYLIIDKLSFQKSI